MRHHILSSIAAIAISILPASAQDDNCFSILTGRNCTADGSVMLAHNEDDSGEQMLNLYISPADRASGVNRYVWAEFPGMKVADSFMNEYGVCICSDACGSREDEATGTIVYKVRTDVAKYAHSAREAVDMIGKDVEEYGYEDSGRSYMVADPEEGWIVSIVRGHHWVAMRVPDDKVLVIPNCYVMDKVDLSDKANFAGSADLIEYAVSRGWYNPETDGEFSFRKAYGAPKTFTSKHNTDRHAAVLSSLTGGTYEYDPLTVEPVIVPSRKLTVSDMAAALSLHGKDDGSGKHPGNVCLDRTVLSAVFQLRGWMPKETGCIMWMCPGRPCAEAYIPVYLGTDRLPEGFSRFSTASEAEQKHFSDASELRKNWPEEFYWKHISRWEWLAADYRGRIGQRQSERDRLQEKIFSQQEKTEKRLLRMTPERASRKMSSILEKYSRKD